MGGKRVYRTRDLYYRTYGRGVGTVFKAMARKLRPVFKKGVAVAVSQLKNHKLKDIVRPIAEVALDKGAELAKQKLIEVAKEKVISRLPEDVVKTGEKILADPVVQQQIETAKQQANAVKEQVIQKIEKKADVLDNQLRQRLLSQFVDYSRPNSAQESIRQVESMLSNENHDKLRKLVGLGLKRRRTKGKGKLNVKKGTGLSLL